MYFSEILFFLLRDSSRIEEEGQKIAQLKMASRVDTDEEGDNKGSMWDLDQKLDQPMEEEAGRLRNMYREKV